MRNTLISDGMRSRFASPFTTAARPCGILVAAICMLAITVQGDEPKAANQQPRLKERLLALHTADAAEYAIYRDSARTEKLELQRKPVYNWTNVIRSGGQSGAVFVWTYRGCPEVVGSIFSSPDGENSGQRRVLHEMHTLSTAVLVPVRDALNRWQPKASLPRSPIPDAPAPAETPRQRLVQMRELAREFSAQSVDYEEKSWQFRLLTQPLYRYESTEPSVIDGALFAFVTSAGTDPEVIIVIEARQTDAGLQWQYAVCRFSDHNLYVKLKGTEVWTSIRGGDNVWEHNPNHTYRLFTDRRIPELSEDEG
ncbi:MAG: hypothetical protein HY290_09390 [Planctomycetia bacterium]|nr:hypothetical protein [Planctomycetia bacterium]